MRLTKAKYLSDSEFKELNRIINQYMDTNPRDCLLLKFAITMGARAQEILNVRIKDLADGSVYIETLKKGVPRELPVNKKFYKQLMKYIAPRRDDPGARVFPISYQRLDQIWRHYRPVEKKFHSLRHSFAIRLYKKTKDIHLLKYSLGHKSLINTQIYMDYFYTQSELRKAML